MMPLQCLLSARRASPVILIFSALLSIGLLSSPAASASTAASPKTHQHHQHHAHQHHSSHQEWDRTEIMDENGLFILEWNVVDAKEIVFKITANTGGFIGLGFSYKTGKMANSDLVLAWVDDHTGKPNVLDCHGPHSGNGAPIQDDTQNYVAEYGMQNATHTIIQFRRSLETCDPHDLPLGTDTIKVLWAYGERDPVHGDFRGHGPHNRGVRTLHLMEPMFKKPVHARDVRQWDVTVRNVSVESNMDTLYWCKILRAPALHEKHHIIGYEAILSKEGSTRKPLVHHMTLFECSMSSYPGPDSSSWDVWVKSNGAVCNSNLLTPRDWDSCINPVAVWAIGATGQFLPEHVGVPIGGRNSPKYYMLEIHYDNPQAKKVLDNSGFRIHYTRHLRPNDGGMMISGVSVSDTQMIPPGQKLYRNVGICGPSCTGVMFPEEGINIVSVTMHSHVAGRQMKLRHVREGKELERIIEDSNYDFAYQQVRQLRNETNVKPGDYLITDCAYETLTRRRPTLGGYSTKQEMCLSFITYYPRIELAGCYSMTPVKEFFETFRVYQFYSLNMTDVENLFLYNGNILDLLPSTIMPDKATLDSTKSLTDAEDILYQESILNKLVISDPVEFHDRTFLSHLNQLPWSEPLFTRRVEQTIVNGKHMSFCRVWNESRSVAAEIFKYPNFTTYIKPPSHCPYQPLMMMEDPVTTSGAALNLVSPKESSLQTLAIRAAALTLALMLSLVRR